MAKKKVRKQSSSRLSTLASKWLRRAEAVDQRIFVSGRIYITIPIKDLKSLCASVLSQDETKGQR